MKKVSKSLAEPLKPWRYQLARISRKEQYKYQILEGKLGEPSALFIAELGFQAHNTTRNARLIASTPDLFNALDSLLSEVEELHSADLIDLKDFPALKKALNLSRAAIKKARGE